MSTTAKKTTNTARKVKEAPLPDSLRTVSITEALEELHRLSHLVPSNSAAHLHALADEVATAAARMGMSNVRELIEQHQSLLTAITGITQVTQIQKDRDAEPLHRYRNMIHTLTLLAAASFDANPAGVHARMTKLSARTHHIRRALTDDEILLARAAIHAGLRATRKPTDQTVLLYAIVEAGLTPGEGTTIRPSDFDDVQAPAWLDAPGNDHIGSRIVELDAFTSTTLGAALQTLDSADTPHDKPIAYRPRKNEPGKPEATASSQAVLDRFLKLLGLHQMDTTSTSIRLWRINHTLTHDGVEPALTVSGIATTKKAAHTDGAHQRDRLYRLLGTTAPAVALDPEDKVDDFLL